MTCSSHADLQLFERNSAGRDFAVGDIHGYFCELERSLAFIGFNRARDRLFAVGDLVDRGPQSAQVLQWLEQPWFHSVRGNHEIMACNALLSDAAALDFHMRFGGQWLHELDKAAQARMAAALRALPLAMQVQTAQGPIGLVHADLPTDDWQDMHRALSPREISHCLWSIERYRHGYSAPVRGVRAVVHGHVTVRQPVTLGNVYFIDTKGGKPEGRLTFLNLQTLRTQPGAQPE